MGAQRITRRRSLLLDLLITTLLAAAALALYAATLAPTVLAGDPGEFQFAPYLAGITHPTGYPLYTLLGWAWSHLLPLGDPAYRMNLFSALCAALAAGLLYPTARALLRQALPALSPTLHRLLAILAAATLTVTPTLWSQAVIAEVYGLHSLFAVLLFFLVLTWRERRRAASLQRTGRPGGRSFLFLAAFCFGLGLAHHRTTILLAPALLAYVWLARIPARSLFDNAWQGAKDQQPKNPLSLVTYTLLLLACCLPLLLYLYIPLRAPHTPYLRLPLDQGRELVLYENTLGHFLDFVTGGPFGGSVDFSVDPGQRLAMTWDLLRSEVGWIGVILALVGILRLLLGRRWALLALTGLAYAAVVAFNLVYTIGDIFVLYIPAYLVVVLWMAVGVGAILGIGRLGNWQVPEGVKVVLAVLFLLVPVWMATRYYTDLDQSHNTRARGRWEAILAEPLPPGAVLVSNDRNDIMPLWYFQYVDGVRPDLLGLFPLITPDYPEVGHVLDLALGTGRPVYLIKGMEGIAVKVGVEAEGALWRVFGPAVEGAPAYPVDARLGDALALVGYDLTPADPRPGEALQVSLVWEALRPLDRDYHSYVHLLDASGQKVAQSDRQPGGVYYPSRLWRPGERLRDDHLLEVPAGAPPNTYRLLAGMYALAGDGTLEPLGAPVDLGPVDVRSD